MGRFWGLGEIWARLSNFKSIFGNSGGLVLEGDLFGFDDGESNEIGRVEVGFLEGNGGDLVVAVGRVIENALFEVVAGRIDGVLELVVAEIAAAVLLLDGMEDVEKLVHAGEFVGGGAGI